MRGDHSGSAASRRVPDNVLTAVYGMGFSPTCTAVLDHRLAYVLLMTASRERDPYSIVSLVTRCTVERFADADTATVRLDELAREPP